jgi:hypothetical protein
MPGSSKWCLSLRFPRQNPVYAPPLPHMCHMPSPSQTRYLYTEDIYAFSCSLSPCPPSSHRCVSYDTDLEFYVLLTVHLGTIFVNNQLDAHLFFMYVYFCCLRVSGSHVPIIRRVNCINTTSGICHSV